MYIIAFLATSCHSDKFEEYSEIQIIRDQWGVPHIQAPTDAEASYGLAWAQCEDDFVTIQEQMMAVKGLLGEYKGKDGIVIDFAIKFMGLREYVDENYHVMKEETKAIISAYVAALNAYGATHKSEVLDNDIFPLSDQDMMVGYLLGMMELTGASRDLQSIMENKLDIPVSNLPTGSNAIAISSKRTREGQTFLAINSHQPLEGWYSWYEAHLVSDEGLNILGGTFPGGATIFHGVNQHLGWAHTVNHADFSDVYQLEMNPDDPLQYRFDDQWLTLKERAYWSWLKIAGPLKIPIRKKVYESVYGPAFETEQGFFSWSFSVLHAIKAVDQWHAMNRARNFSEFQDALRIQGIPSTNTIYADDQDNIYYLSNGIIPQRSKNYNWRGTLPGNTSETQWEDDFIPFDSLPQLLNPPSGYLYNTNNTPFSCTDPAYNIKETPLNLQMGFQRTGKENNRSARLLELLVAEDTLSYADFKRIKYDLKYPDSLRHVFIPNLELMLDLDPSKQDSIQEAVRLLNNWDRSTDVANEVAPLFIAAYKSLQSSLREQNRYKEGCVISVKDCASAIAIAQDSLMTNYGKLKVPLGETQRLIREDLSLPLAGGPDVLAAMYASPYSKGIQKGIVGESYISLVRFDKEAGPIIETVHAYGASTRKGNKHSTDQMELFVHQQLKSMTLDMDKVMKDAVSIYSPMRISKK